MAYEQVWDQTWERVNPGHYVNGHGAEVTRTGPRTWTLSVPQGNPDTRHRTLKAAQAAAEQG